MSLIEAPPVTKESVDELVQALINIESADLSEAQSKLLSKALFPDTHTEEIELLGIKRKLRPLTVKYARRINSDLKEIQSRVNEAVANKNAVRVEQDMQDAFTRVGLILCEYYGWTDYRDKIEAEDVQNDDLLMLAMTQQNVQGTNDFLLMPLRLLLKVAQLNEILAVRLAESKA